MKKYSIISAICLLALVLVAPRLASAQPSLLTGSYGYEASGSDTSFLIQISAAGLLVFDGAGHVIVTDSVNVSGTITRFETYTGTYTVNSQGIGSLSMHSGVAGVPANYDFVLVNGGAQIILVGTDQGLGISGIATKQVTTVPVG